MSSPINEPDEKVRLHNAARELISDAEKKLNIDQPRVVDASDSGRRRSGSPQTPGQEPGSRSIILVDRGDGGLEWRDSVPRVGSGTGTGTGTGAPRRSFGEIVEGVEPVATLTAQNLPPNKVVEKLISWDGELTPHQGLRILSDTGELRPINAVPPVDQDATGTSRRILLIVHGTFSSSDAILEQLKKVEPSTQFLAWARSRYQHILTFDHPTMSVSPILNALDLKRCFSNVRTPVDVICHSRGGLVVRWWLEAFGGAGVGERRVVFVAAPLGGTSLASPYQIRKAFSLFTTVGTYLKTAGQIASVFTPFATITVGFLHILVGVTGTVADTPIADLFFSAVPGLGGMSRVGNNNELSRLHLAGDVPQLPDYFAVYSDFQMQAAGWKFWRLFHDPALRGASWGANMIFDQANDLVVDNRASIELFRGKGISEARRYVFENNGQVHHTNYFLQPRVLTAFQTYLS